MVATVFGLGILLTVVGHKTQLEAVVQTTNINPSSTARIIRLHNDASGQKLAASAAACVNNRRDLPGLIAGAAFRILLEIDDPLVSAGVLGEAGSFTYGTRTVNGLNEAADLVFGTSAELLSDAEISLFCYWTVNDQDGWGPDDILATRRLVLRRLLARRVITDAQFSDYNAKSLALRPTPIPIY